MKKTAVVYWSGTGNTEAMAKAVAEGSEVLEEMEFQPMFDEVKRSLGGKSAALFGSYGWGDGEWMRGWEKDCDDSGIRLVCESVTCCEAPDDAALDACRALGKELAK